MKTLHILTSARLREVLHYEPSTGVFTWRIARGNRAARAVAGGPDPRGYNVIAVDGVSYRANRLAWLYMTGRWPQHVVDHKDSDATNDRWKNLRDIAQRHNSENQRAPRRDNSTGYLGVHRHADGRFKAEIRVNGRLHYLGLFDDAAVAHQCYLAAKRDLHKGCTL